MIDKKRLRFLNDLVLPLTPVVILGAFAVFVALVAEPATEGVAPPLPAPFAVLLTAIP